MWWCVIKTHGAITVHKIVHGNHEERDIDIDRCNPRLCKMHKIKGKQEAGESRCRGIAGHFLPQQIEEGQHGDAK